MDILQGTRIATSASNRGLWMFTTKGDGTITAAQNDMNAAAVSAAMNVPSSTSSRSPTVAQADGWYAADVLLPCAIGSSLCAFSVSLSGRDASTMELGPSLSAVALSLPQSAVGEVSLFYETTAHGLRGARLDKTWANTDFIQPGVMPGTDIAEVHSSDGQRAMLFFQDKDGFICYRRATQQLTWDANATQLIKGSPGSGIAAVTWNELNDIRLYFQDENYILREYIGSLTGPWTLNPLTSFSVPFSSPSVSLGAVSWAAAGLVQIRIYFQDPTTHNIMEWQYGGVRWILTGFVHAALPGSDVVALVQQVQAGFLVDVIWTGPDLITHQMAWDPSLNTWLGPVPQSFVTKGATTGIWGGTRWNDLALGVGGKSISKIRIMCGAVVDGFALDFTDGTSTPWNGGKGGKSTEFDLSAGETITMVLVAQDGKDIQRLCFITSSGRQSENYGYSGGAPVVWQFQGAPLVGFAGAYGKASFENNLIVQGLQPIWGGGQAKSASDRLQSLAQRVEALGKEIATGRLECAGLQKRTSALQDSLDAMSKCIGARAMAGIAALVGNIQKLYTADSTTTPALISACKDQGNDVAAVFDVLHMQSVSLMKTGEDLATEAVKQASDAQTRLTQVGDISAIASTIQAGESQEQKTRQTYAQNAQQAIKLAEDSLHAAQDKASKDKKLRIVRDVFSFGAGELGDWGGLNGAISFANAMVQSTQANLSASTAGLASVEQSVQAVQAQLDQTRQLQAELDGFVPALRQLVSQTAALQEKDDQLMSSASDLSIFLGTLWATSETLPVDFTAQRFASQVLALGSVIGTDADLGKALTGDLQQLQTTLDLIAKSPITPLATTGMI